jgi:hypothetical protein
MLVTLWQCERISFNPILCLSMIAPS